MKFNSSIEKKHIDSVVREIKRSHVFVSFSFFVNIGYCMLDAVRNRYATCNV